ncbi:MAG: hypothetical protein V3W10_08055 [candidate division NC10 bacterium]
MDFIGPLAIRGWASSAIDFPRIVLVTVTTGLSFATGLAISAIGASGTRLISVTLCPATATFTSFHPWVMAVAFTTVGFITGERM